MSTKTSNLVVVFRGMYLMYKLDFSGLACTVSVHILDSIVMVNEPEETASRYRLPILKFRAH
jgi:hypothetical protein